MTGIMNSTLRKQAGLTRQTTLKSVSRFLLLFSILLTPLTVAASPLFDDESILEVELTGPISTLYENRREEPREQLPFTLVSEGVKHEIKVRVRGKSRVEFCQFPPLRLNFKKGEVDGTVFAGQDKLKLVTQCNLGQNAETDVLEEYAAYRIFNELTDLSFRVRLLHIHFQDTGDGVKGLEQPRYGFLIEPIKHLAERNGGMPVEEPGVALKWLEPEYAALMYLHQYLIGNTDWSLAAARGEEVCCHNVTLIKIDSMLNPVPFDFDMSGLVNAQYARPHPNIDSISRVTQRLYRGYCTDPAILRDTIQQVAGKKEDIVRVIDNLPLLKPSKKEYKIDFLEKALKATNKEEKLIDLFEDRCLG
jgi:hypothetical protein